MKIIYRICLIFLLSSCSTKKSGFKIDTGINKTFDFVDNDFKPTKSILFYMKGYSEFESFYKDLSYEIIKNADRSNFIIDTDINYPSGIEGFEDIETDVDKLKYDLNQFDNVCYILLGKEKSIIENIKNQNERKFNFTVYVLLQELKTNKIVLNNKFNITSKANMFTQNSALGETIVKELKL